MVLCETKWYFPQWYFAKWYLWNGTLPNVQKNKRICNKNHRECFSHVRADKIYEANYEFKSIFTHEEFLKVLVIWRQQGFKVEQFLLKLWLHCYCVQMTIQIIYFDSIHQQNIEHLPKACFPLKKGSTYTPSRLYTLGYTTFASHYMYNTKSPTAVKFLFRCRIWSSLLIADMWKTLMTITYSFVSFLYILQRTISR